MTDRAKDDMPGATPPPAADDPNGMPPPGNGHAHDAAPNQNTPAEAEAAPDVAALQARLREAEDRMLRDRAELENFKRRTLREKAEALRYASEGLLRDLLPVLDNLDRAIRAAAESRSERAEERGAVDALITGVEMVQRQLLEALERHGVTRIDAKDQAFDPAVHEAVVQIETDSAPAGTVVEELIPGYRLHDRLLRAAQVGVAKPRPSREN